MRDDTVAAVMRRLGVECPAADLTALRAVYAAWCSGVSFDNVRKLIHLAEGRDGPLPGSTSEDFFAAWLAYGTGGTCWAGNGALHDLLAALGFDVARGIATMLPSPGVKGPNHGTVIVTVEGERWIADASILSGDPIRIPAAGDPVTAGGPLPRFAWLQGTPAVWWRSPTAPQGFPCRIDRIGASASEWDGLYERTRGWGPFNFGLHARVLRGRTSVGVAAGQRFALGADGSSSAVPLDREGRRRFLVEELGVAEAIARQVPRDRPLPPRPAGL